MTRYYVRHDNHYPAGTGAFPALPAISYIRDRYYNCADVVRITRRPFRRHRGDESVAEMRERAERVCAAMNEEHKRWLAATR